nr:CD1871A family CXXC motif-containing protein [uncultured Peptostreptococcus sp.]
MKKNFFKSRTFSIVLVLVSMLMIYHGYNIGEAQVVLDKAIRICMECIGIG